MASPYRSPATSPPYPSAASLPNPKKRQSIGGGSGFNPPGPNKRRKQSSFSTSTTSTHPLRQTSFPPEESQGARSPSVDSDVFSAITDNKSTLTSNAGAGVRSGKRGRGKGSRGGRTGGDARDGGSARSEAGGRTVGGGVAGDGRSKAGGQDEGEEGEDEMDEENDDGLVDAGGKVDRVAERKKMAVLIDAFNPDQNERYDQFRRNKLKKETMRRIVNQTLSQSVPPSVITTINGFTKVFIGHLIERAREVQSEWSQAEKKSLPTPDSTPSPKPPSSDTLIQEKDRHHLEHPITPDDTQESEIAQADIERNAEKARKKKQEYLGPMLPDHLREGFRRYKRDGAAGSAGITANSLGLGMKGIGSARLQGRRLFR
ncbi:hypothetical protein MMC25_004364 [Agyrium rufum]|nr:hypothetical protein [Agyrium rufum]